MSQLLETIRLVFGQPQNLELHQSRLSKSLQTLFGQNIELFLLSEYILPPLELNELPIAKCRVLYEKKIEKIEYLPYQYPKIRKLKLVKDNKIEYSLKFAERTALQKLLLLKEDCDDIIIIKNGKVTDSSFANLVFFDGRKYFTPATPLLNGTQRQRLLLEQEIFEEEINLNDITFFKNVYLINSMLELKDKIGIPIERIKY